MLEVPGERALVYVVSTAADADRAMEAIRGAIALLMRKGGCRSVVIGVHVEGADCDHELGGAG
ncbi:MAG TPA: hypothetical protein VHP55_10855 [Usitatibacter sp.]|nr:hypothetical protein [Usitatibacter sp.]